MKTVPTPVTDVDRRFYAERLEAFLPEQIVVIGDRGRFRPHRGQPQDSTESR